MDDNIPKRISFPEISEIVKGYPAETPSPFVINGIAAFRAGWDAISDIISPGSPYIIEECRIALVKRGTASVTVNMMEYEVCENTIIFFGTGCIVQPHGFSPDVELCGMMLSNERMAMAIGDDTHLALTTNGAFLATEVTRQEVAIADNMFALIWELIHQPAFPDGTVNALIRALFHYYECLGMRRMSVDSNDKSRDRQLFELFIRLVNAHCRQRCTLAFYADSLCITPRYLGVTVKGVSGITAKEWIDRAVCTSAKVMLRHGNKQIAQIADELCFANPSFFCKFFRRMTGRTPLEYRHEA